MLSEHKGDIFTSKCQTLVNTINCVGVMGAGIALQFKQHYPGMFTQYQKLCQQGKIEIGKLWLYKTGSQWILNFPTKHHWRYPSKRKYLESGLEEFMQTYKLHGITSIAFPLLGAGKGSILPEVSREIMKVCLRDCTIRVELWEFAKTSAQQHEPTLFPIDA